MNGIIQAVHHPCSPSSLPFFAISQSRLLFTPMSRFRNTGCGLVLKTSFIPHEAGCAVGLMEEHMSLGSSILVKVNISTSLQQVVQECQAADEQGALCLQTRESALSACLDVLQVMSHPMQLREYNETCTFARIAYTKKICSYCLALGSQFIKTGVTLLSNHSLEHVCFDLL